MPKDVNLTVLQSDYSEFQVFSFPHTIFTLSIFVKQIAIATKMLELVKPNEIYVTKLYTSNKDTQFESLIYVFGFAMEEKLTYPI